MGNGLLKIVHVVVMVAALVLLAVLLVLEIKNTGAVYRIFALGLLIIWAAIRVFTLLKNLLKK